MEGKVNSWNRFTGSGFVKTDDGRLLPARFSDVINDDAFSRPLEVGERVVVDVEEDSGPYGRKACNIRRHIDPVESRRGLPYWQFVRSYSSSSSPAPDVERPDLPTDPLERVVNDLVARGLADETPIQTYRELWNLDKMPDDDLRPFGSRTGLRVFLCYSSDDRPAVREIYHNLLTVGVNAWFDEEMLLPGQDWELEIIRAIRDSHAVVVCLSPTSLSRSGYVQKEIRFVLDFADQQPEGAIFVIPALLKQCAVPDRLSKWQWVNLYEKTGPTRLIRALRARAQHLLIPWIGQ
jgi:cold shock CspA family protein